jgi:hypothetical protein
MSIGHTLSRLILILAIAVLPACDDNNIGGVDTVRHNSLSFGLSPSVQGVIVPRHACVNSLSVVPFHLVVTATPHSDLVLTETQMRFVDRSGLTSPELTVTHANLTDQLGSTHIVAAGSRTFQLEFPVACTFAFPGTLTVGAVFVDSQRREQRGTVAMTVL